MKPVTIYIFLPLSLTLSPPFDITLSFSVCVPHFTCFTLFTVKCSFILCCLLASFPLSFSHSLSRSSTVVRGDWDKGLTVFCVFISGSNGKSGPFFIRLHSTYFLCQRKWHHIWSKEVTSYKPPQENQGWRPIQGPLPGIILTQRLFQGVAVWLSLGGSSMGGEWKMLTTRSTKGDWESFLL